MHVPLCLAMSTIAVLINTNKVDEELRVFKYSNTEWELEGELEEFSSFDGGAR